MTAQSTCSKFVDNCECHCNSDLCNKDSNFTCATNSTNFSTFLRRYQKLKPPSAETGLENLSQTPSANQFLCYSCNDSNIDTACSNRSLWTTVNCTTFCGIWSTNYFNNKPVFERHCQSDNGYNETLQISGFNKTGVSDTPSPEMAKLKLFPLNFIHSKLFCCFFYKFF